MSRAKLHLIDGSGYIYRAFYAVRHLSTSTGEATNALHGFSQMLEKTLRDEQPTHLAIVFDSGKPSFRNKIYPEYKANRDAPPEDLIEQIPKIHELVKCFRVPTFVPEGFEADDVIATLTRLALEEDFDVRIISGDKDLMQLVSEQVILWEPMRGKTYGPQEVEEYNKLLVPPHRVRDALALAGDSSDNVPGVRGIGPKKAAKLIADFGDLEAILQAAQDGKVKGKMGQVLAESLDEARLSLKLVTLDEQVELEAFSTIKDLAYLGPDKEALKVLYEKYEFRKTSPRVGNSNSEDNSTVREKYKDASKNVSLSRENDWLINSLESLEALTQKLNATQAVAVALELSSSRLVDAKVIGWSFFWDGQQSAYLPLGHTAEGSDTQLDLEQVLEALAPVMSSAHIKKYSSDSKLLHGILLRHGCLMRGLSFDPELAAYLLEPDNPNPGPEKLARELLSHEAMPREQLLKVGKKKRPFEEVPVLDALAYMSERAEICWHITDGLASALDEASLTNVLRDVELPLVPVLARIELAGIYINADQLAQLRVRFGEELKQLEARCYEVAGKEFNLGSPKQLRTVLYEELGLKITKTTKTGPSTDHAALEAIAGDHPLPQAVIEHRTIQKLQNTYVEALPKMQIPSSGRVHTQLNQTMAATGRLSSTEPNLQNIPIRTELGRELRKAFIAESDRCLISVDYSQVELRVLAHFTGDDILVKAFEDGADVHARTASALFDVPADEVTREQRTQAKAVNFGVLYGMGAVRLARELQIPRRTASKFVEDYFERQPGVRRYIDETLELARKDGAVKTIMGRRRWVADISSKNRAARAAAERIAINTPIQGSAADLIKLAMLRVDALLRDAYPTAKLILQVHDELLIEATMEDSSAVANAVKDAMQRVYPLRVPLDAVAHIGQNWDEAH